MGWDLTPTVLLTPFALTPARVSPTPQENIDFSVTVITPDVRGNGTDGGVTLTLIGEKGESEELSLSNSESGDRLFERNATDKFIVTSTDVGALQYIRVKMSGSWWSPAHSDWQLQEVQVLNTSSGVKSVFALNDWVAPDTLVTLTASSSEQVRGKCEVLVMPLKWAKRSLLFYHI